MKQASSHDRRIDYSKRVIIHSGENVYASAVESGLWILCCCSPGRAEEGMKDLALDSRECRLIYMVLPDGSIFEIRYSISTVPLSAVCGGEVSPSP